MDFFSIVFFFQIQLLRKRIIKWRVSFKVLDIYLKIFLLLYAADTVLMSENVDGMQTMLNVFSEYYNTWKLQVNIAKTKVVFFSSHLGNCY
jgi:hypothetical protein